MNKTADAGIPLTITCFQGKLQERFDAVYPAHDRFNRVDFTKKTYLELFPKERLVYLTADAEESLEHLVDGDVYIIGGIVDRNRYKVCQLSEDVSVMSLKKDLC